jgi:signal transduction histidine kinase
VSRDATHARIAVHDNGPGVAVERRAGLFDALVTTKPNGTGLGLFSVKACATALGGRVDVGDSPLGGAVFSIVLPVEASPSQAGTLLPVPPFRQVARQN